MNSGNNSEHTALRSVYSKAVITCGLVILVATTATAQDQEGMTYDGLVPVEDAAVAAAFIDPEADFSVFERIAILDPFVAFRSNWQRDQNRNRRGSSRITARDMERIKTDVARLFKESLIERMEVDDGFEVVEFAYYDVLVLRPAIIDLDVTAPDTRSPGRTREWVSSAGAATLYLELFDSVTGEILGRVVDRQSARRNTGNIRWGGSVSNIAEARRVFGRWADQLRSFLDEYYVD